MGIDTKKTAGVGGGYGGRSDVGKVTMFVTGLLGQDGTGANIQNRLNQVVSIERKETTDQQKRRTQGYRGL